MLKLSKNLTLTDVERRSVSCLLLPAVNDAANNDAADFALPCTITTRNVQQLELMYSQKLKLGMKQKQAGNGDDNTQKYMNLDVLVGTSVSCERLFSAAKFILTDLRKSMSPTMFEAILLLKVNRCEWDVYSVGRALGRTAGSMSAGNGAASSMNDDLASNDDQFDGIDDLDLFYD